MKQLYTNLPAHSNLSEPAIVNFKFTGNHDYIKITRRPVKALALLILLFSVSFVQAATRTASVSGNWSATATWGGAAVPVDGDNIIINSGVIVTVDVNTAAVTTIVINAPTANNGITISGSNILNATGAITMNAPTSGTITSTIAVGAGTLNAASIAIPGSGTSGRYCTVSVSTGTINVTGAITFSGTAAQARLTFTGAGALNIGGNFGTGGTFTASTGTVNCNGSAAAQTIAGYTYNNLTLNNTFTTPQVSLASTPAIINGLLTVTSCTFALGANNVTSVGSLTMNGGTISGTGTLTLAGDITANLQTTYPTISALLALGSATRTFTVTCGYPGFQINSIISGTGGITLQGGGLLHLAGTNTYTGITTINAGNIHLGNASALGSTTAGTIINNGGSLDCSGFSPAAEPLTLNGSGSGGTLLFSSGGSVTYAGLITLNSASTIGGTYAIAISNAGTITGTGFGLTLDGAGGGSIASIIGTGTGGVTVNSGTWTLSGVNTYTGTTTISAGTLKLGGAGRIADGSDLTVNGTFDLAGFTETVAALSGTGTITSSATGTPILTVGDATNSTFSGIIQNGSATSVALTKAGTGTLTMTGANTYTGVTTINAGILSVATIGDGGVVGNLGAASNVAANLVLGGGTLQYTGATASTNRNFTLTTGTSSTLDITTNNLTLAGASTATTGALTKDGAGTLILSGANLYTGLTTVLEGTLKYGVNNALSSGALTVNGGIFDIATYTETLGAVTLTSGTITGTTGVLTGTSYAVQSGTVSAILAGAVALTKTTAGTVTLSGVNTYTGITTINAGVLSVATIGNGGSAGNLGAAAVTASNLVLGGGTLQYTGATSSTNRNFTLTAGTTSTIDVTTNNLTISGASTNTTGALIKVGTGTLILTGTNLYTGLTTVTDGTLQYGVANALSSGNVALNGGSFSTGAAAGFGDVLGTLALSDNSDIILGTGVHTLSFTASNGVGWTSGKILTITGWVGGYNGTGSTTGGIIKVGATNTGLTATQLAQIQFFNGSEYFTATILSTGEVVPLGNSITAGAVSTPPFCVNPTTSANGTVAYTAIGFYNSTTLTAKLSDAAGNFTSPVSLGTAVANGMNPSGNISITIPAGTPSGTGYKIRIDCSTPAVTGTAGAAFEIINGANNVSSQSAAAADASAALSWTNPTGCYDEIMIVAKAGSSISGTPSGDGTAYSASLAYGSGTAFTGGGYVVYKGISSPQTVTSLTNLTQYYFKFFTRKGTDWSSGVETNATPIGASLATDYFRSRATGLWNATATWESSHDGTNWFNATLTPTSTANTITIQSPHVVTISASVSIDQATINAGGQVTVNSGQTLTIADGTGTDLTVNGTIVNTGTMTFTGQVLCSATSTIEYNNSGAQSILDIASPGYGNLTLSNGNTKTAAAALDIQGNLTINTSTTFAAGTSLTHNIGGDWTNNGTFSYTTASTINLNGSNTSAIQGSSTTTFNILTINKTAAATTVTSSGKAFTVSNYLTVTQGNLVLQATDANYSITNDLTVAANGTLTHSVNWDTYGKLLAVGGNIAIDGIFDYTVRSHVQMTSSATKTVRTGSNAASSFSILTLMTGTFNANGPLKVDDNFWAMFNTTGSFHTSGQTVTASAGILNAGGTFYIDGGTLNVTAGLSVGTGSLNGAVILSSGTLNTDALTLGDLTRTGTFSHTGGTANIGNLIINTTSGNAYTCTGTPAINITGNWTNNRSATAFTAASSTVSFNGSSLQTIGGTFSTSFYNLDVNNVAGVSLAIGTTTSNTLSLTSGILTTTNANLLSVTRTASSAITGGSATSFINGPVKWTLPASLVSGSTYNFPMGKGTTYLPYALVNPTTGTGTVTAQAEAFTASTGGTYDGTLASISTTEYWSLVTVGNFTNSSVSLTRQTAIAPLDVIGGSTTLAGQYTSLAGTAGTYGVTGSNAIGTNRFFVLARLRTITTGTISGSPFCAGDAVSIPFTSSGTYNTGNIFTAQLSNASGSFASPVAIGTLSSTTAGTISGTIPAGQAAGTGYRIRVISSNPTITGSDNGTNLTVNATPTTANAGGDQNLCNVTTATLAGNTATVGTGLWSVVSGTATITTPTSPTSGITGLVVGASATLRWTISNPPCTASTDDVVITVSDPPTTANAGPDQTDALTCGLTTVTLAANTPAVGTGAWSIVSGTGGTITTPSSPTSTFSGTAGSTYTLRWTITNGSCTSTDDVVIKFNQNPTIANAGPDQTGATTCGLTTVTLAANAPTAGTGAWSIVSGTGGTVTTPSSPSSTFSGTAGSTYTLRWTISNSPCTASADEVDITFNQNPTAANAGGDQSNCNSGSFTLTGNTPSVGTGVWSLVSGTATITSPSSPTSGVTGVPAGTNATLRWTISHSPCAASADDVILTNSASPSTANAGPDQTGASTCGLTTVAMAGNTPTIGTGLWSVVTGTGGSFSNASSPTSNFTGTAGTAYNLRWTISNPPCTASSDDVLVTFNQNPIANAGPDQTGASTCGLTTVTLAANNPTAGTGLWSIVSGTGGSFGNTSLYNSTFSGTAGATYTLAWTVSNPPCNPATDNVVITFNVAPTTANAGPDQTGSSTCGLTTVTLEANTPTIGTGAWSIVSGTGGSFGSAANPASTFTGVAGNTYTLRWTISYAPCTSTDDVVITFNLVPVTTGTSICQGGSGTLNASCPPGTTNTVGPRFPTTGANSGSGTAWSSPTRVVADDNSYTTVAVTSGFLNTVTATSQTLKATNFGFTIPANATIDGVVATIGRYASANSGSNWVQDNNVQLIKAGTATGSNLGLTAANWPTGETAQNYGSTSNLWGITLNPTDINNTNFGLALVVDLSSSGFYNTVTAYVDYVQITVTYTTNGVVSWYTASSGGTSIGTGTPFNPVGVSGSGLPNTNTPGTYTFYAECSTSPYCRTATDFVIGPAPTPTISGPSAACATSVQTYSTEAGMSGYTWAITGGTGTSSTNSINVTWGSGSSGNVNVTYTSSGCGQSTPANLGVTLTPFPTANAGPDATVNQGTPHTVSGASSSSGTILWTTTGPGSLTYATTLTPTYTPGPSETSAVVLTLTAGNALCQTTDDMVIYYIPYNATWTGNAYDNDWHTSYNWDVDAVPGTITDVVIPNGLYGNYPTISSAADCHDITIESDASLVEVSTFNLNIHGTATVKREIPSTNFNWHFLSSPVTSQPIWPSFATTPSASLSFGSGPFNWDFYYWNPKADTSTQLYWVNLRDASFNYNSAPVEDPGSYAGFGPASLASPPLFTPGRGYLVAYGSGWASSHEFQGILNSGTVSKPIVLGSNAFNLVGNPYPSSLDWQAGSGWTRSDLHLNGSGYDYWIWNDAAGAYGAFNSSYPEGSGIHGADRYIAPTQAFFVQAGTSSGSLGMNNDVRAHSLQPWLKKTNSAGDFLRLRIASAVNSYSDEWVGIFNPFYSIGGTEKWWSFYTEAPALYSVNNDKNYCISLYPGLPEDLTINLNARIGVAGTYTIEASNITEFTLSSKVLLEDLKTSIITNLKQTSSYSFTGAPADDPNRFRLIIGSPIGIDESAASDFSIWAYENAILLQNVKQNEPYSVTVSNMLGQILVRNNFAGNSLNRIELNRVPGVYIVTVVSKGQTYSKKVVMR